MLSLSIIVQDGSRLINQNDQSAAVASIKPNPFGGLILEAEAVYVFDLREGQPIFGANEKTPLPLASLAKIATVLTSLDYLEPSVIVQIPAEALTEEGDSGLLVNEKWRLDELAAFSLLTSSNDGAKALALITENFTGRNFEDLMNLKASALGLSELYFLNPTGLDASETESGAYGSAEATARLLSYGLTRFPGIFSATNSLEREFVSASGFLHRAENTNSYASTTVGLVVSKTGFTDLAGGNLAVVFEVGPTRPIIAVILGSTPEGRFSDMEAIIKATLDYISNK